MQKHTKEIVSHPYSSSLPTSSHRKLLGVLSPCLLPMQGTHITSMYIHMCVLSGRNHRTVPDLQGWWMEVPGNILVLSLTSWGQYYYSTHFTDMEVKIRENVTFTKPHRAEAGFESSQTYPSTYTFLSPTIRGCLIGIIFPFDFFLLVILVWTPSMWVHVSLLYSFDGYMWFNILFH